jgi:transposase
MNALGWGKNTLPSLVIVDSQAVKNTDSADIDTKGFCAYKSTNGIKRHLTVDTLGLPLFIYCSPANLSDDLGLVDMFANHEDWFKNLPENLIVKVLLDKGYHINKILNELRDYPHIAKHIDLEVVDHHNKAEIKGFKPVKKRWVIERTNAWTEKHRVLWKNCEGQLSTSEAKLGVRFIRLILARLVKKKN